MIIQLCGLSGSGKTTLAFNTKDLLRASKFPIEVIDGDEYRKELCADLGFSRADRNQNIRRLAFVSGKLSQFGVLSIICAINPYEAIREEVKNKYDGVKTVFVNCDLTTLINRDTKGMYKRALLPDDDPEKISNLTGVNAPFEYPSNPDLIINTHLESVEDSVSKLYNFIPATQIADFKS